MRALLFAAAACFLIAAWVAEREQPLVQAVPCNPDIIAAAPRHEARCYVLDLPPLQAVAAIEAGVDRAGGTWAGAWEPYGDLMLGRALQPDVGVTLVRLSASETGLIVLREVPIDPE